MFILLLIDENGQITGAVYAKNIKRCSISSQIPAAERAEEAVHDVFVRLEEKYWENFKELRDKPGLFFVLSARNYLSSS